MPIFSDAWLGLNEIKNSMDLIPFFGAHLIVWYAGSYLGAFVHEKAHQTAGLLKGWNYQSCEIGIQAGPILTIGKTKISLIPSTGCCYIFPPVDRQGFNLVFDQIAVKSAGFYSEAFFTALFSIAILFPQIRELINYNSVTTLIGCDLPLVLLTQTILSLIPYPNSDFYYINKYRELLKPK